MTKLNRREVLLKAVLPIAGITALAFALGKHASSVQEQETKKSTAIHSLSLPEIKAQAQDSRAIYIPFPTSSAKEDILVFKGEKGVSFYQRISPRRINDGSLVFEEEASGLTAKLYQPGIPGQRTSLVYPDLSIIHEPGQFREQYLYDNNWRNVSVIETLNKGKLTQRKFTYGAKLFDGLERIETFDTDGKMTQAVIVDKQTNKSIYQVSWNEECKEYVVEHNNLTEKLKRN